MKAVFIHHDYARVVFFESVLKEAGILTFIRNENTHHLWSGVLVPSFYPALCVMEDSDEERATGILRDFLLSERQRGEVPDDPEWPCPQCGEPVPGSFDSCWKCQAPRPPV